MTRPDTTAAARRHDGPCPVMRECGGCTWLGLPYRKQLARKQAAMEALFEGLLEPGVLRPIVGMTGTAESPRSPRAFRYKAATPFAPGPRGRVRCGFFARGTHDIVFCPECAVEAPGARELLNEVSRIATRLHIPAYDEDSGRGLLRYAVLRVGWRTDEMMLTLVTRDRQVPRLHGLVDALREAEPRLTVIAQNINPRPGNAILGGETRILFGPPRMRDQLLGCTFEISPTSFYQTNPAQTEVLYQLAIDGMELQEGDVLLDAYCGSGTIGLCAADAARADGVDVRLLGVERNPEGIRDARRNAELNGLEARSEFVAQDATEYLLRAAADGKHADILVLDPPRAGSTPKFLAAAAATNPRRIIYISCNPTTQARDFTELAQHGYRCAKLTPVDMFPHTGHVETVCLLTREKSVKSYAYVDITPSELGMGGKVKKPTYKQIQAYVLETHGLKVSPLYIANVKDEFGLEKQFSYEEAGMSAKKRPNCPSEKRAAIIDALIHFGMLDEDARETE